MNNFKTLISSRRKELKMTQKELAQKLNVSDKTVSKWETGTSYPEITLLATIAKVLEINISELLGVEDLQEKKIEVNEEDTYNYDIITKYKNKTFLSISLIFIGLALLLAAPGITNSDVQIIMYVLGFALYTFSLIFFIGNNIDFRCHYKRKFYTREYDNVFVKFSSITIIIFTLPFIFATFFNKNINFSFDNIEGIVNMVSIVITIISYFSIVKILYISGYKLLNDITNIILGSLSILLFLIIILSFLPYYLLPIVYFLGFVILFRNKYINNK